MKRASVLLRLIALLLCPSPVLAQAYPGRRVRLVVPSWAGGAPDIVARAAGQRLAAAGGQPVIVDNRAGASGMIGAEGVARAPADGTMLLMATPPGVAGNHHLFSKVGYNPERDFAPITLVALTPFVIAADPGV